tara:strand:- start:1703 stop:2401 length:699 start_codon:yes stop_codon:yes gene_type:complete
MARNLWLALGTAALLHCPAVNAQIFNNGIKTACINNNCRSKSLPRQYKALPSNKISNVTRQLYVFENNLSGARNSYAAGSKAACDRGFRFGVTSTGAGVCSPRRIFSPSLNTHIGDALNDHQIEDTTLEPSTETGSAVSLEVREQLQAANEVIPNLNRTRATLIQVEEVVDAKAFQQEILPEYVTPRHRRAVQLQTVRSVNESFRAADVDPLNEDMFRNTFPEAGASQMKTP